MIPILKHEMRPDNEPAEIARGRLVSEFRSFILNDLAQDLRLAYDDRARKSFVAKHGREPATSNEVHDSLRNDPAFKVYSLCRINAQKMVWNTVIPGVKRDVEKLELASRKVANLPGSLMTDPDFETPRNVAGLDVHLMPGSYVGADDESEMIPGAVYDRGLAIFSMGLMGDNSDDIGLSMSAYIRNRYPQFEPKDILDIGCTIGHNTLPWKTTYPDANVHAIDASGPCLRYASTRAKLQDKEVHFHQMNAEKLDFPDNSFDVVFSSMFFHEVSVKATHKILAEAYRVLRPGGLLLTMELPPNKEMGAFEGFYLDWDSYYNEEPFYKAFRDQDPKALCSKAGFPEDGYFQFVVPSMGIYGPEAIAEAARSDNETEINRDTTGRLADGVQWFGFGAWKK